MIKKISYTVFGFIMVFSSCKKDEPLNKAVTNASVKYKNILVNNTEASLNTRVTHSYELLPIESIEDSYLKTGTVKSLPPFDYTKNYVFRLVSEVNPPVHLGSSLQATHVDINGSKAFVTYNTRGDKYLGGIDVFDVTDIKNPTIISQAIFPEGDVSAVDYYNNKLYVVGATGDATLNFSTAGFLEVLSLNNQSQISGVDTIISIGSYAGTDVKVTANEIIVTSGSTGFLTVYDHSYKIIKQLSYPNARSVGINASTGYLFQSEPGRLISFSLPDFTALNLYTIGGAITPESKSEIAVTDKYIFAALNETGMKMLNLDGSVKQSFAKPATPPGELDANYVTNSVTINSELVMIANGEAGLYLGGMVPKQNDSITIIGKIKFNVGQSANFVKADTNIVFVATGLGGLKILTIGTDNGLPPVIIPTKPCATLYDRIIGMFPERTDNKTAYPDLFAGLNKNIKTTTQTDLYVTFIAEGAGWKNSFGYYAYPANTPPTSIADLQKYIVYPNVSALGDGGALQTGDMVRLGDKPFPANTIVGFYLIAQGWRGGVVTNGNYTHYTNSEFNTEGQQHLLFIEKNCNDIVITFEDIVVSQSDKDFNDIILTISDNKDGLINTKIDTQNIPIK